MALRKLPDPQEIADRFPHIPTEVLDRDLKELEDLYMESVEAPPNEPESKRILRDARVREIMQKYDLS